MAIVSVKPQVEIDAFEGQYQSLQFLPELKNCREIRCDRVKKATRILRHLANDAASNNPNSKIPSTWVLRAVASSHLCGDIENDWRESIYMTLAFVAQCANGSKELTDTFVQTDQITPLFQNDKDDKLSELRQFANSLIAYLNEQGSSIFDTEYSQTIRVRYAGHD